jgi:myo-inositol-1(or 4)-monophosphatase
MHPLLATALDAAEAAAAVHRRWAGRVGVREATEKQARDFVSQADVEAQRAALSVIHARHPDHQVLAEEEDGQAAAAGGAPTWVVDPIDGTTNFLHGHPMYCVSIAVVVDGEPEAGVVMCPPTSERWWATRGGGAFKNGKPMRVSDPPSLRTALVGTGFPFKAIHLLPTYLPQLGRVLSNSAGVRRGGAAALDLAFLASGIFDAFWELDLKPWDVMAGILLIREAGGVVTRVDGSPIDLEPGSVLGAANPQIHAALKKLVEG